jgi:hypothetical protein
MQPLLRSLLVVVAVVLAGCDASGPALPAPGPNAIDVRITTKPAGATVVVDGIGIGPGPQTVKLNPGPHRVKALMNGYYPAPDRKVQIGASEPREIVLTLVGSH